MGLVVCRRLVEMMGGTIRVASRPSEGSTFEFDFVAEVPAVAEPVPAPVRDAELGPMRILVAEDNQVNQIVTERMLLRFGCGTDMVADGEDAVRQVQEEPYDLVLMDLHMPGVDGLEAARRIRSLSSAYSKIPIVALSASATIEDREACFAAGMNDYLSKPLALEALQKVLSRWGPGRKSDDCKEESAATSYVDNKTKPPQPVSAIS